MFNNVYSGKKVLVTGHTGFKGTWLIQWLKLLGAEVLGISNGIPSSPSMFEILSLETEIAHCVADVRNAEDLFIIFNNFKPDFMFHLAAQAIVSNSYDDPLNTISTNVLGTANVLDCLRRSNHHCIAVIITSDKCYENVEWEWGYRESDRLGGKDVYSASKGAAEVIFHSYFNSFLKQNPFIRVATARAGNVIGGGDWAKDRIVVDSVLIWCKSQPVQIRSPEATRPWQHVMEPLSGYLSLGANLMKDVNLNGESFNFGPQSEQNRRVIDLIEDVFHYWKGDFECYQITGNVPFHEAGLLKLNCDKALMHLKWTSTLTYEECVHMVGEWYSDYYLNKSDVKILTIKHINDYMQMAFERNKKWTQ